MAESSDENDQDPIPGLAGFIYAAGFLFTFFGGIAVLATDQDVLIEEDARKHGDGSDAALYPILPLTFMAVWCLLGMLAYAVNGHPQPRLIRAAPVIAWILPALWFLVYLVVFRPR